MALEIKDLGVKFYASKTKAEALALATLPGDAAEPGAICFVSDNTGNYSNAEANVTATLDKLWLLSEFEVQGGNTYANQYEQNKQAQYDYYKNGASKTRYEHQKLSSLSFWFLRSAYNKSNYIFCSVQRGGSAGYSEANGNRGVVPCFTIS